jgi:hypothetical protein
MSLRFTYIIGVEGCGHHGLCPLVHTPSTHSREVRELNGEVYSRWPPLREVFSALWYTQHQTTAQRLAAREQIKGLMVALKERAKQIDSTIFVIEDNSFPSADKRSILLQWDIVEMTELVRPFAEITYLVLYRDPIAMTFSHPEFDGGSFNHARVTATFLQYLNSKLQKLPSDLYTVINYEDMIERKESMITPMSRFLRLSEDAIRLGFAHIKKSNKDWRTQTPQEYQKWMIDFFSKERCDLWPIFTNPKHNILNRY